MVDNDTFTEAAVTLHYGTVSALQLGAGKQPRVRVKLSTYDNVQTWWLAVLHPKAHTDKVFWMPDIGEHVAVLLDATGEQGVVLGAIYSEADTAPAQTENKIHVTFGDGAMIEYDRSSHVLTVNGGIQKVVVEVGADILLKAGAKVTVDAPEAEFTGNVTIDGDAVVKQKLTYQGGMAGSGGSGGAAATISGNLQVDGNINASGSIMDAGGNSNHHSHP